MNLSGLVQLGFSTLVFLLAATLAKSWALAPSAPKLVVTLLFYTLGNLIMLRLIREFGMGVAFSISSVFQLVAVNAVAFAYFHERVGVIEGTGILLAVLGVAVITLGPMLAGRA
ncbi:MAG: hypothetical protein INR68_01715 [Methylobacterium mesophilicum]|nr:hypothetical protein [Methylobacterium mesophilicum]